MTADVELSPGAEPTETRAKLPRWVWALVVAIGLLLFVGWSREDASVARLSPSPDTWFGSEQPAQVELTAGETKTIYWRGANTGGRGTRSTADCRAVDRSGADVELRPAERWRVGDWSTRYNVSSSKPGSVTITCHTTNVRNATFGVGQEVPPPRLLNGVANYSGNRVNPLLLLMAVLSPALIIFSCSPAKPIARAWVFRFGTPLVIATALVLFMSSVWEGFSFWITWYAVIAWSAWRGRSKETRSGVDERMSR